MVAEHTHEFKDRIATNKSPYHFVDSGLPNVYLVGIKYRVCESCSMQSADIPAVRQLLEVIARTVVESESPLTGAEIRFLRKRLGKKSTEFGRIIGVTQEQVSRWENNHSQPEQSADRLIRIFYCMLSGDRRLKHIVDEEMESFLSTLTGEAQASEIRAVRDSTWRAEPILCTT